MTDAPAALELTDNEAFMRSVLQRVATGPEYSKNLPQDEARRALSLILDTDIDEVQAGIYLIALRMKRETLEENAGSLQALLERTRRVIAKVPEVIDIAEPYDGVMRNLSMAAFLPAVLAACGKPAVCHGVSSVGPKFGATPHQVLRACGVDPERTVAQVSAQLEDAECGWGYVDQSQFCPELHALQDFRTRIVKRPVLTTVEVLLSPIRGQKATHFVTGYVHKPYPPVYAHLARTTPFDSALLVRGVEGGVFPSLRQAGCAYGFHGSEPETLWEFHSKELGYAHDCRAAPLPESDMDAEAIAQATADIGRAALCDEPGPARDSLLYATSVILAHLHRDRELSRHFPTAQEAIRSGRARTAFEAAL